jgi:hypothetical protein
MQRPTLAMIQAHNELAVGLRQRFLDREFWQATNWFSFDSCGDGTYSDEVFPPITAERLRQAMEEIRALGSPPPQPIQPFLIPQHMLENIRRWANEPLPE